MTSTDITIHRQLGTRVARPRSARPSPSPTLGLGCVGMSEFYGSGAEPEARRTIIVHSTRRHLLDRPTCRPFERL